MMVMEIQHNVHLNVTLNDGAPPTAICQNINVVLDGSGNATIVATDLDGGSSDNLWNSYI